MSRVFDAPTAQDGPIPAYKVVEMEGPFKCEISVFDEKERVIKKQDVQVDKGYMVFSRVDILTCTTRLMPFTVPDLVRLFR